MFHEYGPLRYVPQQLLRMLEQRLPGLRIGKQARPTSVIAYADDVTIFVTLVDDFPIIEKTISLFERASGARLHPRNSKALAVGGWCIRETVLEIDY